MAIDNELLTAEESEALLAVSGDDALSAGDRSAVREIGPTYWEQVRPDRVPAFEAVCAEIAAALEQIWSKHYKRVIVASAEPARTLAWREHAEAASDSPCASVIELKPSGGRGLVILQPDTVSAMVDLYFGGTGATRRSDRLGPLTEMERRQMQRFVDALAQALRASLSRFGPFEIARSADPYEPDVNPLCAASDRIVVSTFAFVLGELEHRVEIIVPAAVVEGLKRPQRPALPGARRRPEHDWSTRLREDVKDACVELRAILVGSTVKLADIARARPGDIIATEPLTRVSVYAGNKAVFEGTLGARRGFNAVKITQPVSKRPFGDK